MAKANSYARFATAVAVVALAAAVEVACQPVLANAEPFTLFYAAVMVAAYLGGLWPGLLATLLSATAVHVLWLGSDYFHTLSHPEAEISTGLFLIVASFISILCETLHAARRRAEDALDAAAREAARRSSSEQRAQEERDQLLASERAARGEAERASRMKDEFLSTLSHELRTPLNAVLGWAQILRSGDFDEDESARGLEVIERNALVQAQLIEDLLDMSRIVSGKIRFDLKQLELADIVDAAVQSVSLAADEKAISLEVFLDEGEYPVKGDSARLQQVVYNLLTNAIKFTPRGGRVEVELTRFNREAEFTVRDSGQGIKPDFLDYVFDRFRQADASTTRKYGGMGLGLAIVRQLVELHGGSVSAHSEGEGHGATFTVRLPLSSDELDTDARTMEPVSAAEGVSHSDLRGLKILVVDDEADARELVRVLLRECEATIIAAASFAEAIERFEREQPDVLISDISMPEHDGYELLERLRTSGGRRGATIPAIALTAFAREEDRQRSLDTGFQAHVVKPVQAAELITVVATVSGRVSRQLSANSS